MKHTTVVVGAAQGIGAATARRLGEMPDIGRLVLADVQEAPTQDLATELRALGHDVDAVTTDITDASSIDRLLVSSEGATRVALIAGMFQAKPSVDVDRDDFLRILEVNLIGTYLVAQAYARAMGRSGGGSICAIGSIAARMPRLRQAAYCASKAGMRQALRVLGLEVIALGVRINFVAPGPTATEMMATLSGDHDNRDLWKGSPDSFRPPIPDRRVGSPSDVANAVAFLLSDEAGHVTLHDLYVDGGESLGL